MDFITAIEAKLRHWDLEFELHLILVSAEGDVADRSGYLGRVVTPCFSYEGSDLSTYELRA